MARPLSTDLQRVMDKRSGATVTEIDGSHALDISQAETVAKVIETAAKVAT